ncbi:MAG: thymidine phosphorylase [candidate division WOR-3 bacterium]
MQNSKNNEEILSQEEAEKRKKKLEFWEHKKYICQVKLIDIKTGKNIIVLNEEEAKENDIYGGYRVVLRHLGHELISIVDLSAEMVKKGEIGIFGDVAAALDVKNGDIVQIRHMERPASSEYIRRKLDGEGLSENQIKTIITDLMNNRLSEAELSALITALFIRGMGEDETVAFTNSIVESGQTLELGVGPVADKHCIGGVAGNRTTMVVVPLLAASGVYVPKTSSRAITSAAGTADTMEVLAPVDFSIDELKEVVLKAKGAMVWGGGMNIAAADDKMIKIRQPLSLDPRGLLLASILAKKKAVGAKYVAIDIPIGRGAKVLDMERAEMLGQDFIKIGKRLGMTVETLITDGSEPVGNGVGCGLECKDVLEVLEGRGPDDLRNKSCLIAGKILELVGKVSEGEGMDVAEHLLQNGKAMEKMREIIMHQGGERDIKPDEIKVGDYGLDFVSDKSGVVLWIDNGS